MVLTIIGAGPGGYETAAAAAARGQEVHLVTDGPLGGTCLNEGCIPTKTFCRDAEVLENLRNSEKFGIETGGAAFGMDMAKAVERKDEIISQLRNGIGMLLKNKLIHLHFGKAAFKDQHTVTVRTEEGTEELVSDYIIIATGSVSSTLPIPGNDSEGVITSREMLSMKDIPARLCVIGAGVIGLEFASIFRSFGSEVTVLEYCRDILPRFDTDMAKRLKQTLSRRGISIETSAQVRSITQEEGGEMCVRYLKKDAECEIRADRVLMAVGRRPNVSSLNLDDIGIEYTAKGIVTDEDMRTNVPHIFAIGDVRGGMMLAHVATFEGKRALNTILEELAGRKPDCPVDDGINLAIVPAAVFTSPEAATVGMTEDECREAGIPVRCLKSFFRANGKAVSMDETEGYCKIVVAEDGGTYISGQILGCHMFGPHSSDIIQEIAALMNRTATVYDLKNIVHAHPTLSEVLLSAAGQA